VFVLKCITPKAKQPRPLAHTPRPRAREEAAQFVFQPAANEVFKKAINISQKGRAGLGAAHLKVPSTLLGVCQKFHVLVVFSPLTLHSAYTLSLYLLALSGRASSIFYPPAGADFFFAPTSSTRTQIS